MTRTVVLWRHGRTHWNVQGKVQGTTDVPLDDVGREQAQAAAARLAALLPAAIASSDLSRALDTAESLATLTDLPVRSDERLREMNFGAREGLSWAEAWDKFPEGMQAWVSGDETQIPGSETHRQAAERFVAGVTAYLDLMDDDSTLVVVAHGAVLRVGACMFLGIEEPSWRRFGGLSNCSWSVLEESRYRDRRFWRLTDWNAGTLPEPVMSDDRMS